MIILIVIWTVVRLHQFLVNRVIWGNKIWSSVVITRGANGNVRTCMRLTLRIVIILCSLTLINLGVNVITQQIIIENICKVIQNRYISCVGAYPNEPWRSRPEFLGEESFNPLLGFSFDLIYVKILALHRRYYCYCSMHFTRCFVVFVNILGEDNLEIFIELV